MRDRPCAGDRLGRLHFELGPPPPSGQAPCRPHRDFGRMCAERTGIGRLRLEARNLDLGLASMPAASGSASLRALESRRRLARTIEKKKARRRPHPRKPSCVIQTCSHWHWHPLVSSPDWPGGRGPPARGSQCPTSTVTGSLRFTGTARAVTGRPLPVGPDPEAPGPSGFNLKLDLRHECRGQWR